MSAQPHDDDVVTRLRADAPGYPDAGPDAARTLAAIRRSLRRARGRRMLGGAAAVLAVLIGLTAIGPIYLRGIGTFVMPFGYEFSSLLNHGEPSMPPRQALLDEVAGLQRDVPPVVEDLGLTAYVNQGGWFGETSCRGLTWSRGAFQDRHADCGRPDAPRTLLRRRE